MLLALKNSPEKRELVDAAVKYLRGVKGHLVQQKKKDYERAMAISSGNSLSDPGRSTVQQQLNNGNRTVPQYTGLPVPHNAGPPRMDIPVSAEYTGPIKAVPGSVGAALQGQEGHKTIQAANPGSDPIDDHAVESALRGFLGH
jgi:hypothetical protein